MSNVLKPDLIWIEGRCYRMNEAGSDYSIHYEHDLYENERTYQELQEDDVDEDDYEVQMADVGRYYTSFHVSKHYLGNIIGKKGATKMRIQRDTNTDIKIPRIGENKDILIYGSNIENVKAARRKINMIVISVRKKQKATHFVSIPLNHPDIQNNFNSFKESVLKECQGTGLEESIFILPSKLHVTVGVMCLMDNEERLLVSKLLTDAKECVIMPIIKNHLPIRLRMKGLSYMNDEPQKIDVLYSCVEEENAPAGLLQNLVDAIADFFRKKGFMRETFDGNNLKIHVTLLNSRYRGVSQVRDNGDSGDGTKSPRESFDGSDVLKKFNDFDFGVAELTEIHLSQMKTMGPDGYYQPTCVIKI